MALIGEAWDLLHDKYVGKDTLDDRELAYSAIDGLADAVGDTGHTTFMTPEDRESRNDSLSGSYVGIGVQVNETDAGQPVIVGVFRDSPADQAGLATGDVIVAVDGRPTLGETMEDVLARIRGERGTSVDITVRAGESGPERTVEIVRAEVEIDAVSWTIVPGTTTGLLRIEQFSNGVADDVKAALEKLREAGADRLILDLRGNPGGYVGEAVGTASQFLASGTVYVERNAAGEEKPTIVSEGGAWTDLPLVVLVDQGSASSSEIVSGALQDHDRATVVGMTTFGTGTVLGEFGLSDGSALRIGTVEWLTPDGRRIWHEGIEPDVEVERPTEVLPTIPDDLRDLAASRVDAIADPQLERALEIAAAAG
jgi:carboxyl-terminal processing protease